MDNRLSTVTTYSGFQSVRSYFGCSGFLMPIQMYLYFSTFRMYAKVHITFVNEAYKNIL